jgi:1-phosphatidylinositol phosphodiesterase
MLQKNSLIKRYILRLVLLVLTFLVMVFPLASCGDSDSGTRHTTTLTYTSSDWMSIIDGNKLLSEINIPGTHESGTMHNNCDLGEGKCQDMMPIDILNAGGRILDLRLHYHNAWPGEDAFIIRHGICHCYTDSSHGEELNFDHVLDDCIDFLTANPKETVILLIKQNSDSNETIKFTQLMEGKRYLDNDNYKDKIYLGDTIPKLDDVRGKIVWVRRYDIYDSNANKIEKEQGINLIKWDNQNSYFEYGVIGGITIKIQDAYNYFSDDWDKKWNQVYTAASDSVTNPEYLVLNLTSAVGGTVGRPHPKGMADKINPNLAEFFIQGLNYDWIIMDFITSDLARNVYESNSDFCDKLSSCK